jgi:nicotinamidase-related amidase
MVREQSGNVIWIGHCGKTGDGFEPHTEGWSFLPVLRRHSDDVVIEKTLNDPFFGTSLQKTLERIAPDRVLVVGWATDSVSTRPSDRPFQTITTSLLLATVTH